MDSDNMCRQRFPQLTGPLLVFNSSLEPSTDTSFWTVQRCQLQYLNEAVISPTIHVYYILIINFILSIDMLHIVFFFKAY